MTLGPESWEEWNFVKLALKSRFEGSEELRDFYQRQKEELRKTKPIFDSLDELIRQFVPKILRDEPGTIADAVAELTISE